MAEADAQILELLTYTLRVAEEKRGRYKYFELHVCHSCFHEYVADYVALGLDTEHKRCELCGQSYAYPIFEVLFVRTTKRRVSN
jgi:rRNA maturation endonuclease Nob1